MELLDVRDSRLSRNPVPVFRHEPRRRVVDLNIYAFESHERRRVAVQSL
jgi:hypothetical protein